MIDAKRDNKLAAATVALLNESASDHFLWLTEMAWLSRQELVDRLAAMPKPVLCAAFIQSGTLAVACAAAKQDHGGSPLADLDIPQLDVEFGEGSEAIVLTASEHRAWLSQYNFILLDLQFVELHRANGTCLRALVSRGNEQDEFSTVSEWPIDSP
mgnify:CR=1 FL=1